MPQLVDVDGLGTVEFPDDFTPAQIEAAWQSELKPLIEAKRAAAESQQRIARGRNAAALPEISPIGEGFKGAGRALESSAGNVIRGLTKAVVSPLQTAGTIADYIRTKTGDAGSYQLGPDKRSGLTQLAEGIEQKVAEYGPRVYEEHKDQFLAGDVASGLGQVGGMLLGGGAAALAAKGLGKAVVPAAMAATTTMGFTGEFGDAFERAKARGDDADTALAKAMGYASVASLIENKLGAGRLLKKWMPDPSKAVVALTKAGVAKEILKDLVVGYGEEALQRAAQDLIVDGKLDPEGINREGLAGGFVQALVGAPAAGRRYQMPQPQPVSPIAASTPAAPVAPTPVSAPQVAPPQAAPITPAAALPAPAPVAPVVQPVAAQPIQQAPPKEQLTPPTAAQRSELEDIRGDLEAAQLAGDTERVKYLTNLLRVKEREAWTKKVTVKPRRVAITPEAQAAAPAVRASMTTEVSNLSELINQGGGQVRITDGGVGVAFDKFALSIDGDEATVGYVELKDKSQAGSGIGKRAYIALGRALLEKGITLKSSGALLGPGHKLWTSLVRDGYAIREGSGYSFTGNPLNKPPQPRRVAITPEAQAAAPKRQQALPQAEPLPAQRLTPFPQVPEPERFDSVEDLLKFRRQRIDEQIALYQREIGLTKQEAERLNDLMEMEASTKKFEQQIGPEKAARLNWFFEESEWNKKGGPFQSWETDRRLNPEVLVGETDKDTLIANIRSAVERGVEAKTNSDTFLSAAIAAKRLQEIGGTLSDVARHLDRYTTQNSSSQGDKAEFFKSLGAKVNRFLASQGVELQKGDIQRAPRLATRPEASMPARPAAELGIERGRVSPVDPDLAAAVEDIRGGYAERTARELEADKSQAKPATREAMSASQMTPAERSTEAGQKKMAEEAASVATVTLLNQKVRAKSPADAWDDKQIQNATGNQSFLNSIRDDLLPIYNRLYKKPEQAPTPPAEVAPAVAAKEPWEMTRADLIRGLFSEPSTANDFIKRLDEFDSLPAEKQKAFMRDKYPDYAYAGRMTRVTGDGQLQAVLRLAPHRAAVEAALREGKPVPPAVLADYPELVQKATPAAAPKPASNPFDTSASSKRLTELQSSKPRPIVKFFGPSGGTPEQRAAHEAKIRKWNSDYRKALRNHKELVEKSNEWIRSQKETPSTQPPYAPQEQAPVEVLRNQPPGTPAQVAEGKPREVSEAAGEGAPEKRDKSKPEQMDQNEFYAWSKARARRMQDESGSAAPFMQETQQQYFRKAFKESLPINADSYDAALKRDVKRYLKLPEGYIRKGELYVFEKAIPEAAAPTVAAKEPWEMTREEYKKTLGGRTNQMTGEPFYPEGWPLSDEAVVAWRKLVDEDRRLLKAKLPTSKDLLDWKGGTHLAVIQQAISEGKPVPPAVLADYPELKQAAGKAAKQPEPAYISPEEVDTVGKTKSGQPVRREVVETLPSEAAGEGAPEKRDKSKPEQMTPEEYVPDGGSYKEQLAQAKILAASLAAAKKKLIQNVSEGGKKMIRSSRNEKHREAVRQRDRLISMGESGFLKDSHGYYVRTAASKNLPLSAAAVDTYGIKLPPGYIREGDLYVYRPEVKPEQAPSVDVGEQQVLDEIAKLKSVTGPLSQSERIDLNELRLSAQNKKLSRLSQAYLENLEERAMGTEKQMSLGQPPAARPAPSLSKMQVEQAVRELFDGNTPPNFQVTHNYGKTYNGREVRGWYDPATGTIWLNAAYLRSPREARAVFIEEAFHAIQNDKSIQKELSRLVASLTPEQLSSAKAAYGNISEEQLRMEAVADILEQQQLTQEQRGILARLWDAVLGAVQRLYGKFTGKVFTERDAQDVLAKALKAAAAGRRTNVGGQTIFASNAVVVPPNKRDEAFSLTAHHGTPHQVDKFTTGKIGTGEGAQVYGWGLYFAENEQVAKEYQKRLSGKWTVSRVQNPRTGRWSWVASEGGLRGAIHEFTTEEEARRFAFGGGSTYTVTLNVEPDELLDWDKPLSQQSEKVRKAIVAAGAAPELMATMEGAQIYRELMGGMFASDFDYLKGEARKRTERLVSLGIKGIRYRDQGTRFAVPQKNYHIIPAKQGTSFIVNRGVNGQRLGEFPSYEQAEAWVLAQPDSNQPTYNYVIFNEDDIKITHANGQPVTVKEAQAEQALSVGPLQNQLDQQYLAAVQRGDMQEVQRLVDEAARGAGYNVGPVFHGTTRKKVKFISPSKGIEIPGAAFLTDNEEMAEEYVFPREYGEQITYDEDGNEIEPGIVVKAFIRLKNPATYDMGGDVGDTAVMSRVVKEARRNGNDGVVFTNVRDGLADSDNEGTSFAVFESNQTKSANPITYDDSGNIIPLSQRFQQESPDIRYSLGGPVKGIANENTGTIRGDDSIGASQEPSQNQQRLRPLYQDQGLQAGASGFSVQNASRVAKDLESSGAVLWGTEPEIEAAYLDANSDAIQAGKPTPPTLTGGQVFRGPVYPGTKATSEGVSGKPRVLITRAAKSLLLLGQSNSDILAHRFLFGADKASNHRDFNLGLFQKLPKLRIVFEPVGAAPLAAYYRSYDTIIVNQAKLDGFDLSNPATAALLDAVISEELIHAAVNRLATNEEILSAWTGLSDMERKTAKDIYGITNPVDGFTDIQFANEYLRLVLQQRLSGKTTEQVVPISSQLKKILQKLVDFLKRSFGNKPENSVARQLVERIEGAIRGNAPIKQPLFPSSGEALATNISQSDATEVQGRAIEPSIIAAAGRAVADLGRQTVDEFEQAGRELEGLAYESKAFRQARSELNNLVSLHEGRLRQLPQDRVTNDMRANIRDGVSIENGQIVVGDELVAKLAQMGVQARPELVKAMQAEVYFEQQARRLVDNLGKLATLKELKDYYTRIKAPADEIENLNKLIAAKEKVVANLTPVTTNRGRGQQSIGERASEITRANASKVELQSKRDALALEPVQEFFGKGIAELRDLSEKAKAAADLTRALMDSTTSVSELARLGAIYDKWASFDATVKDALVKGTLTDEQRVAVLTDLQKSFHEFDSAKFRMDDLLNSEEKGLLKDIREAEAAIADAKVTSGLADVLVADALKAAKGEMGLTGTVGDTANIANLEASTGAITTLAMNLGRTLDQNRWLYDFLVAPGSMPAFGASVAQSLGISETALREILKVVQQSPSLASAIVTLTDDAAAKLAASPPLQMQSIAQLATSGNPAAMALAANLTNQIVQQANAQGTKANAARQAAARQLAQSVLRLRTLQQGQALFNQTANSPAFQQLRQTVSMGASEAQKMVVLGPTGPVLRGFKTAAKEYQPELKIDVQSDALELKKTRDKVWKYLQNAEQYVSDYESVAAAHAANPANPSPSQLGFDVADYNGLKHAIENQIWPMFLNMGDMDDAARAAQYLTPWTVRKLMKAPLFIGEVFGQYEQIAKMVGGFAGNTLRQQIANYKRGYLNAKRVASQFQDLSKLQSEAMRSHNIKSEDTYRTIFNEMAHYGRLFGSPLRAGFTLPKSGQVVTKADMEFFKRTLAFEEKLRREVTEIDPVTGVRYMRGGKEITRKGAYVGDLGMPRHLNRNATEFIADVTNAYAGSPKGFTSSTDLSANSADSVVKYWNEHLGTLKQHILDSLRTDRSFKQSAEMAAAEKKIAARWMAGNVDPINSVQDLVDLIAAEIPATTGKNPADVAVQGLNNELLQYVSHAEQIQKERADDNAKTSGLSIALSSENEFTKPAADLELPSEYYDYGAVTSIDRITALSRANHSALVDFANSLRLSIKELENRIGRLQKATTDKEREAILENYKGNPQEMEDVLQLLRNSLRNFEDSYRAGGPDVIPTKLGQKLLKATVGSVLAKVEIAARNLSQGQIQVLTNLWAMNYMSASLAAWKALSNVPRGAVNTGYLVARNIAGFADRRLGRDPQFQRTLKGAVDMVADAIFKSAQLALLKPRVGAANVQASFERVQNLGFDISDDWWDAAKQAWRESGQFRTQLDEQKAGRNAATWAANFIGRLANTGADAASAFVRGSVLEASDLNMNALSLGLVGNMEQRLQQVAMVFGKRLTDAGITEIDPANKDAMLRASEWLPSMNQQTAVNSLAEIRKFLESSASSEGFQLEKNLLQYYQDKMAGKPARMFNQRTYDAVQRSMIAENNAALPTNRASAGQASQLWRTMLALTGYPADAMLKLLRVSTGGSRDRKVVLQAASKMTAAIGFAAMAIIFQAAGDAGSELWKRKVQGKKPDRVTPLDADFWSDPEHMQRAMGKYLLMSAYFLGDFLQGAYGWVDGKSTIDPTQRAFVISTASQILRDLASGANIKFVKGGSYSEAFAPLRRTVSRLAFGVPELENMLGMDRDSSEAARKAMAENARAKGMDAPVSTFRGVIGLTNIKRKALSQAVSDMEVAKRKGDTDGYNKAKAEAQKQIAELEAHYLKQRLEAGDSPEVAARTAKSSVWSDYQDNNPVTAALGGKRPTAEQYKQLVESSTGERGQVIRQGIKAWQDGAQALFGKAGSITKEDVAENRSGGTVKEPSYGRVSLTGGVSGRMRSVGATPSRGRRAKIRRVSLTGRRRRISPLRGRRKKIRRVRLTA